MCPRGPAYSQFAFAGQTIALSRGLRKPGDELLCIGPADVVNRWCIVAAVRNVAACLRPHALAPLSDRDKAFTHQERAAVTPRIGCSEGSLLLPIRNAGNDDHLGLGYCLGGVGVAGLRPLQDHGGPG